MDGEFWAKAGIIGRLIRQFGHNKYCRAIVAGQKIHVSATECLRGGYSPLATFEGKPLELARIPQNMIEPWGIDCEGELV